MEQRLQSALNAEAERVSVDVDVLWRQVERTLGARRPARRGWVVAGTVAAALMLVIGAVVLSTRDEEPAGITDPPVASPTATHRPKNDVPGTPVTGRGPVSFDARRIDGQLVRGEILLVDVRAPRRPVAGPDGQIYTYAYPCVGEDTAPVCISRTDESGQRGSMNTVLVSPSPLPGEALQFVPWTNGKEGCCFDVVALAASERITSMRIYYPGDRSIRAESFDGEDWPFPLLLALGPHDTGWGAGPDRIEIDLRNGVRRVIEY